MSLESHSEHWQAGPDAPSRAACTARWPRTPTSPMPDLSSSSALGAWLLGARPLLLGKPGSCTLYLIESVRSAGWGRHHRLVDGTRRLGERKGQAAGRWQGSLRSCELGKTLGICTERPGGPEVGQTVSEPLRSSHAAGETEAPGNNAQRSGLPPLRFRLCYALAMCP